MASALRAAAAVLLLAGAGTGWTQVATDGSVGARVSLTGPQYAIASALGRQSGGNLLHSFSLFSIGRGEAATFSGPGDIARIIARVTGGSASAIDGTLRSTIPGASLYLVNPAGVVFGDGAALDVGGSFHASTAHYLQLADGTRVSMSATPDVVLSAAPIAAFGFDGPRAGLAINGAQLVVRDGQRLGFSAGDIAIGPGSLLAAPAGAIELRGDNVTIEGANVRADTRDLPGIGIDIAATGDVAIRASNVTAVTTGTGDAGALRIEGRDIAISGSSLVDTSCDPGCTTGAGGPLSITASGTLRIQGTHALIPTYVVSNSFGGGRTGEIDITAATFMIDGNAFLQGVSVGSGDGSAIRIRTGNIVLRNGGQVDASVQGTGRGGRIEVVNTGAIMIEGGRANANPNPAPDEPGFFPSGIFSNALRSGAAGDIVVSTRTLDVLDGGEISSAAGRRGIPTTGVGGSVTIDASERITLSGFAQSPELFPSGVSANTFGDGDGGSITLRGGRVEVLDGARIETQSAGTGRAGTIRISGSDLVLGGGGRIANSARGGGDAGTILVDLTGTLSISGPGSAILSITGARGAGGNVVIEAARVELADFGAITAQSTSPDSDAGDGGTISVHARESITLGRGARISTSAPQSDGGDIRIGAASIFLDNAFITTEVGRGQGAGGNVDISAPTLVLRDSAVSANAFGGPGGNIHIASETFVASAASSVTASSQLGVDGTVTIESPALDPTGELLVPAPRFDVASVLAGRCGPRLAGRASSLVVEPRRLAEIAPDELRGMLDLLAPRVDGACRNK